MLAAARKTIEQLEGKDNSQKYSTTSWVGHYPLAFPRIACRVIKIKSFQDLKMQSDKR
jgi:hypothetical protein